MIKVEVNEKPVMTPGKNNLYAPSQALASELATILRQKTALPLTSHPSSLQLSYTAIDRIAPAKESVVEALMTYIDTDTLCYRSLDNKDLHEQQLREWTPVLNWSSSRLNAIWQTTGSIMAVEQSEALHKAMKDYLTALSPFQLAALSVISSLCSSLVLAMAVVEKHISAGEAFRLSRLEEESQSLRWGRDAEADKRATRMKAEIVDAGEFLKLLDGVS